MQARWKTWLGLCRRCLGLAMVLVALNWTQLAAAQPRPPEAPAKAEEKGYVPQYALVLLCIALGMMLICKPSGRLPRVKMPDEQG